MASEGLQIDDVIQILSVLADEANLRVTVKESLKGGLITGVTTVLGGLIGGRIGLAIGAVAGGIGAAAMSKDFQGVGSVLLNMDQQKKEILFGRIKDCCTKASFSDIGKFKDVVNDPDMKMKLLKIITDHVESQLKMDIVD